MKSYFVGALALVSTWAMPAAAQQALKGYSANCQACHGPTGAGTAAFPKLAGRLDAAARTPAGRVWMISTVLFGQFGRILVDGRPMNGLMPPLARLTDADVAQALSFLVQGRSPAFTAAEVATVRKGPRKSAAQVVQERAKVAADGLIN
jgi:mono/diheme cytochrome c family protein